MQNYGFTELNLDIEQVSDASPAARFAYTKFVQAVKNSMDTDVIKSLSTDVSASAFIRNTNLADPASLTPLVDKIIVMAYDYHYAASYVTGPVAPGKGAGTVSEFDTEAGIESALKVTPKDKLILGIPLYGYEWETIGSTPRSAVIAGTGLTISNARAEDFLASCASCSAEFDQVDMEKHIIYKDQETGIYHQIFYPDKVATAYKVKLAKNHSLAGIALWALGYEGNSILEPLSFYHN
jgi:spore germination protein YaaH